jgi:hypothetical protein
MKVKMGNKISTLSKDVVACHMANFLSTRAIVLGKEKIFKVAFNKYKQLCSLFLRENKKFVYEFGDDKWLEKFIAFQSKQHELALQEIYFKFSDGSEWTIFLHDIANLKMLYEPEEKHDKFKLLEKPVELADWAQNKLTWEQVKDFSVLRKISGNESSYIHEWADVKKQVLQYKYEAED